MNSELPWIEKYRPNNLSEIVGQTEIIKRLKAYVEHRNVPHLLFSGSAGIGKTSAAVALAKELYGKEFERNFLELNASDARGIDVVRGQIKDFARTLAFDSSFKVIFLDESDALTADAQQALRRTMEKYTKTARFILSCNYSSRIIEPIQSRCVVFRFKPLPLKEMAQKIYDIAKAENVQLDEKAINAINYVCEGDLRKAINVLQSASSMGKKIEEKTIYEVSSRARPEEVSEIIHLALNQKFLEARTKLDTLMFEYGMSAEDIISQLYKQLIDFPEKELDGKTKIELIDTLGEYNFRISQGASERIQLEALIAQFMKFKGK